MRHSQLFGKSIRAVSGEVKSKGHQYLLRGGFIRESSAGRFYLLPLGMKVQENICKIIEEEMNREGGQKMLAPVLHPRELWEETQRTESVSFELMQVKDRSERSFVLGGTAEEMMVALVRQFAFSAKDLPFCIYQFSTKFRDELRARGGMLRAREFLMKDGYSFHASRQDFEIYYEKISNCYLRIFSRLGLDVRVVAADNGYMGGDYCHEFIVDNPLGESRYLVSKDGSYCAHEDIATFVRELMNEAEAVLPLKVVSAVRGISVKAGVEHYGLPAWRQIKSLVYFTDKGESVLVSIRGDLDVNELKLQRYLKCNELRLATEEEVVSLGSVVGFVSPLKLKMRRIGDLSLTSVKNFYTGADRWQKDTINVNYGRDFEMDALVDIAVARAGDRSIESNSTLQEHRGVEVGNIFQLGTWYSDRMDGAEFTGVDGRKHKYFMGCYGIGIGRTLATIAECYRDEQGLCWPTVTSPFDCHLLALGKETETLQFAEEIYQKLLSNGKKVLFDDREVSAGIKFSDADLLGISQRIVVSKRLASVKKVEMQSRSGKEKAEVDEECIGEKL